ncbi:hypothetical protein F8M41_011213 [Gigaspora margarita]|uniref:Uncharacterized protein n=1 Tax=Gigaspora margarita TaxID=4874 RepID=A0A8H4B418_GIGMA|nr:hypothetical protein F8M41_011213 [Gigaspora margarita]
MKSIKFNSDRKAEIMRSFIQKNLKNKKIQPYSDIVDISTNPDTITSTSQQLQQQPAAPISQQLQQQPATPLIFSELSGENPDKIWESVNSKLHSVFGSVVQFEKKANGKNSRQVKKWKIIKVVKSEKVADALRSSGVEVINSIDRYAAINERNNNIEFGYNLNSIRIGLNQWVDKEVFLNKVERSLDLEKLKHFLNLTKAYGSRKIIFKAKTPYDSFKKLIEQSLLRGNNSKPISFKKANNMPLGKKVTSKSKIVGKNQIFENENSEDSDGDSGLERENDNYEAINDNETHMLDIELDDTDAMEF